MNVRLQFVRVGAYLSVPTDLPTSLWRTGTSEASKWIHCSPVSEDRIQNPDKKMGNLVGPEFLNRPVHQENIRYL